MARAVEQADMVIVVLDAGAGLDAGDRELLENADGRCLVCVNKTDIGGEIDTELISKEYNVSVLEISALTGLGLAELKAEIARRIAPAEPPLISERHIGAAKRAMEHISRAIAALDSGFPMDVCAVDMAEAMACLSEITGEDAREAVIDRVFKDFCVGK